MPDDVTMPIAYVAIVMSHHCSACGAFIPIGGTYYLDRGPAYNYSDRHGFCSVACCQTMRAEADRKHAAFLVRQNAKLRAKRAAERAARLGGGS